MAGIYATAPATLLPALVSDWVTYLHVNDEVAGYIGAGGLLAQIPGLLLGIWLISHRPLPFIGLWGLVIAGVADAASATTSLPLVALARSVNGFGCGLLLAAAVNWLGRHPQAERAFGLLTLLQFVVPAVALSALPLFKPLLGHAAIYVSLLTIGAIALPCMRLLALNGGDRPLRIEKIATTRAHRLLFLIMAVAAFAAYNIAQMGIWAFVERYGETHGVSATAVARAVGFSSACGIPGSLLVVVLGVRFGRMRTALAGCVACIVPIFTLAFLPASVWRFAVEICAVSFSWAFLAPYIQGTQASLDETGRLAVWGMVAAALGASSGPALIGAISQRYSFQTGFAASGIAMILCAALLLPAASVAERASIRRPATGSATPINPPA